MENRVLIIGDIHGCLEEFDELLRTVQYDPYQDRLILVGDLMDRGPEPNGVVRKARNLRAECVVGNHEMKYLRYRMHEERKDSNRHYKNPMNFDKGRYDQYRNLSDEDWDYLINMPNYIKVDEKNYVVHAGFEPYKPIESQHPKVMAMLRFVNEKGEMVGNLFHKVPGVYAWAEKWCRTENVIYGHQVWGLEAPRIDVNEVGGYCYGIDTGACYGGHLTCLILPTYEMVQIKSKSAYADLRRAID